MRSIGNPRNFAAGLALLVQSNAALADHENAIAGLLALVALAFGAVLGLLSALINQRGRPTLGQAILAFLLAGSVVGAFAGGLEVVMLFLVFSLVAGLLPMAVAYVGVRAVVLYCRKVQMR